MKSSKASNIVNSQSGINGSVENGQNQGRKYHGKGTHDKLNTNYDTSNLVVEETNDVKEDKNVFAILGFVFAFIIPILGLIFSIIGLKKSKVVAAIKDGKKLAVAGIIISIVDMVLYFVLSILPIIAALSNAQ